MRGKRALLKGLGESSDAFPFCFPFIYCPLTKFTCRLANKTRFACLSLCRRMTSDRPICRRPGGTTYRVARSHTLLCHFTSLISYYQLPILIKQITISYDFAFAQSKFKAKLEWGPSLRLSLPQTQRTRARLRFQAPLDRLLSARYSSACLTIKSD